MFQKLESTLVCSVASLNRLWCSHWFRHLPVYVKHDAQH